MSRPIQTAPLIVILPVNGLVQTSSGALLPTPFTSSVVCTMRSPACQSCTNVSLPLLRNQKGRRLFPCSDSVQPGCATAHASSVDPSTCGNGLSPSRQDQTPLGFCSSLHPATASSVAHSPPAGA